MKRRGHLMRGSETNGRRRLRRQLARAGAMARLSAPARAQATLEFAAVATVLLLALFAGADFARVFRTNIAVTAAARAGVQYGIQNPVTAADLDGMQAAALADGGPIPELSATASQFCTCPGGAPISCQSSSPCPDMRVYVAVSTSAPFSTFLTFPGVGSSLTVTGKAVMRAQ